MNRIKRVYVYEVRLCREDGQSLSEVQLVVTDSQNPLDLLRIAKIAFCERYPNADWTVDYTGFAQAKLLHVAYLDPNIVV